MLTQQTFHFMPTTPSLSQLSIRKLKRKKERFEVCWFNRDLPAYCRSAVATVPILETAQLVFPRID